MKLSLNNLRSLVKYFQESHNRQMFQFPYWTEAKDGGFFEKYLLSLERVEFLENVWKYPDTCTIFLSLARAYIYLGRSASLFFSS